MKINRLMEIVILLLNRKTITARELAERFSVSVRTIYRDIDVLSSAGVPVYMSKGSGGGISLLEDYALNKTLLSNQESESLILALKTMQEAKFPEIDAVLEKVGSVFKNATDTDWIRIDFAGWSSGPNERGKFADIRKAIFNKRVIAFVYINADGQRSHRKAEPESFYFNVHTWYLTAFCLKRNERRIFRLSRIKNVRVLEEAFAKRSYTPWQERQNRGYSKPFVRLKLRFSGDVLHRLYDQFDESLMRVQADDSILVDVVFPEDEWVYGFLLSFGGSLEVIEPAHIRQIVINRMRQALENYDRLFLNMTNSCHEWVLSSEYQKNWRNETMQIELTSQAAQSTIYIRERISLEGMTVAFDKNFGKLAAYLAEIGESLAGPPYAAYYNSDVNDMDTEFGFPVAKPLPGNDEIRPGSIPAYEMAVTATHKGSYNTLHQTYNALYQHLSDQKLAMAGPHYDFYISDPENTPENEILTKVVLPISDKPMVFCQSCGMPIQQEGMFGTNKDGGKNEDYCAYCYKDGAFVQNCTMDEMIAYCAEHADEWGMNVTKEQAAAQMKQYFPALKRWAK